MQSTVSTAIDQADGGNLEGCSDEGVDRDHILRRHRGVNVQLALFRIDGANDAQPDAAGLSRIWKSTHLRVRQPLRTVPQALDRRGRLRRHQSNDRSVQGVQRMVV